MYDLQVVVPDLNVCACGFFMFECSPTIQSNRMQLNIVILPPTTQSVLGALVRLIVRLVLLITRHNGARSTNQRLNVLYNAGSVRICNVS